MTILHCQFFLHLPQALSCSHGMTGERRTGGHIYNCCGSVESNDGKGSAELVLHQRFKKPLAHRGLKHYVHVGLTWVAALLAAGSGPTNDCLFGVTQLCVQSAGMFFVKFDKIWSFIAFSGATPRRVYLEKRTA